MMSTLDGVDRKIARAEAHIAELKDLLKGVIDPSRNFFSNEVDSETGEYVIYAHNVPVVPPEAAVILGEFFFDLRSALDHLAWQLVLLDGGTPGENTSFPIRSTLFNKKGDLIPTQLTPRLKSQTILDLLEDVQPYRGVDRGPESPRTPAAFQNSHLWQLQHFNNIDKHRVLLVVVCSFDFGNMWWGSNEGDPTPRIRFRTDAVNEGDPVAWFDFGGQPAPANFDPHPALHISLRERMVPQLWQHDVAEVLGTYVFWVKEYVLDWRFRPLFTGINPFGAAPVTI